MDSTMAESGTSTLTEGGSSFKIARGTRTYECADYNVAWICALRDTELLAARILLDEEHNTPAYNTQYDRNIYICGKFGEHKVVVACLPSGRSGNVNAGHLTGPMFHTFPNIKITLLVGIGGGVPPQSAQDPSEDMYLGDVVIGWPGDGTPAVVQYDSGRWKVDGFEQRGSVDQPDWHLTQALDIVVSNHEVGQTDFQKSVVRLQKLPRFASRRSDEDRLFQATYKHEGDYFSQCSQCLPKNLVQRPERAQARSDGSFKFHLGTIASGGAVIQDGELRDRLSSECNNARCFEMEAVGVTLNSRCLVIRGLADYADSHKNDVWKHIAAGNAAAFAKELLLTIKASGLRELSGITAVQTPISTLPGTLSIDPDFVGREDVLRKMDEHFTKSNWVALVGLGGIGKTEIAVHYSHKYRKRTPECHIFWVYGSTRQSFDEAYRRIAKELDIPGCDDPLFEHRKIVPRELDRQQTGPWVMIVDNADDYSLYFPPPDGALGENEQSEYLACCLPFGAENGGRLIVTTRNTKVREDITSSSTPIQVSELAPVHARELLRSKIPADKWEDEAADSLLKELDYIPLAITQAAAFVKRNKLTSLEFYLSKLCQHLQVQDVLSYELRDARRQPGTPSAIFRTWQISYQQIKLDNTEAASKLSLMAVLDNQAIPQMLLAKGEALEMAEIDAIQVLLDFSLIKGDEQYRFFSMHPLQQLSTQNWLRLDGSRLEEWQDHGLVLLSKRMPEFGIEKEKRHTCSVLLRHAATVVSYESKELDCRSLLLLKMSKYESVLGRYKDSYQHAVQSYEESLEAHGEGAYGTLIRKLQIGDTLNKLGKYDDGRKVTEEGEKGVQDLPTSNVDKAITALKSAFELLKFGQEDAVFAGFQRALDLFRACSDTPWVLYCLGAQAKWAMSKGKIEKSESLLRQALQESVSVYGKNHVESLKCMNDVGMLVQEQGRWAEAARLHRLVLRGREEIYGMEHPSSIESVKNLAMALRGEGNLVEAEVLGRRLLIYRQQTLGLDNMDTMFARIELYNTLRRLGRWEEAIELCHMMRPNSMDAPAATTSDIASMSVDGRSVLVIEHLLRRATESLQKYSAHEYPSNVRFLDEFAQILEKQEEWEEAEGFRRRILILDEHHRGKDSVGTTVYHKRLAIILSKQGRDQAALQVLQDVLEREKCHHLEDTTDIQELEKWCSTLVLDISNKNDEQEID